MYVCIRIQNTKCEHPTKTTRKQGQSTHLGIWAGTEGANRKQDEEQGKGGSSEGSYSPGAGWAQERPEEMPRRTVRTWLCWPLLLHLVLVERLPGVRVQLVLPVRFLSACITWEESQEGLRGSWLPSSAQAEGSALQQCLLHSSNLILPSSWAGPGDNKERR